MIWMSWSQSSVKYRIFRLIILNLIQFMQYFNNMYHPWCLQTWNCSIHDMWNICEYTQKQATLGRLLPFNANMHEQLQLLPISVRTWMQSYEHSMANVPYTAWTFVTSFHRRTLTSFLRPIMSDKALAWASKLPLSAAIFVGSVLIFLLKSSLMMMQAFVILICGPIYFFHPSMPAICTPVRFAPVYMAAIVHRYQLLYLRFIYMLQLTITTPRLHTTASSHVYVGMPPIADFILYTLCVPWHTYHWVTGHFRMGTIQVHAISETPVPDPTAVIRHADSDTRSFR